MAEKEKSEPKTLEMRVAELEDKLQKVHVTEEEMKAYNKVASLMGGRAAGGTAGGTAALPADCVIAQCTIVSQCIRQCTIVSQCIRQCTIVSQCIRQCTIVNQCTIFNCNECINECGGGFGGGGVGGGGFGTLGG